MIRTVIPLPVSYVRRQSISLFTTGDSMKFTSKGGDDAWPPKHYLNIWTCNLGAGVLGYATLPQSNSGNSNTDGVVILYRAFGRQGTVVYPYNEGRTCTHEVGHWLGLSHIWGDDAGEPAKASMAIMAMDIA
jgi:hypothetical protein